MAPKTKDAAGNQPAAPRHAPRIQQDNNAARVANDAASGLFSDLAAAYGRVGRERDWFAEGAVEGNPIITFAAGEKIGKSWIAIDLCVACVLGTKWLAMFPVRRTGSPIYVDSEYGEDEFARRVARISRAHGADPMRVLPRIRHLWCSGFVLDHDNGAARDLFRAIAAEPPPLLVLDPWRNVMGGDENSAVDTVEAMRVVSSYRDKAGCPVHINHHLNRAGSQSGSRALMGRADLIVEGTDDDEPTYRARGRTLRRGDPIARGFAVAIEHDDDADDTIAATRLTARLDGDAAPAGRAQLSVPAKKILAVLRTTSGRMSKRQIKVAGKIGGSDSYAAKAFRELQDQALVDQNDAGWGLTTTEFFQSLAGEKKGDDPGPF
jgi:hypothetical protein